MAIILSIVKLVQGEVDRLPVESEQGAVYFTTDECIYLALEDGEQKIYGHYFTVDSIGDLPESANSSVLYYIKEKNSLYKFDDEHSEWNQINNIDELISQIEIVQTAVNHAQETAEQNTEKVSAILSDYLKKADKEELVQAIDTVDARVKKTEAAIENLGTLASMDEITEDVISAEVIDKINSAHSMTYELIGGSTQGSVKLIENNSDGTFSKSYEVQVVELNEEGSIVTTTDEAQALVWGSF